MQQQRVDRHLLHDTVDDKTNRFDAAIAFGAKLSRTRRRASAAARAARVPARGENTSTRRTPVHARALREAVRAVWYRAPNRS
jgi:hypothetical protein